MTAALPLLPPVLRMRPRKCRSLLCGRQKSGWLARRSGVLKRSSREEGSPSQSAQKGAASSPAQGGPGQ